MSHFLSFFFSSNVCVASANRQMSTSEFCNGKTNQNLICFEVTNALFRVLIFIYGFVLGEYSRAYKKWIGIVRKPDCVKFIIEIYIAINEFNAINPDAGFFIARPTAANHFNSQSMPRERVDFLFFTCFYCI